MAVFLPILLLALLLWPALSMQLHPIDDHEIITYLMLPDTLGGRIQSDFDAGRWRPAYYALRYGQILLFRDNPLLWHGFTFAVGVATLAILYAALVRLTAPKYALGGCLLLLAYPESTAIWTRLGPQEGIATLLTVTGGYALVRGWGWRFVTCVVAASFFKESFVLLIPAWLLVHYAYNRR